MEVFNMQSVAGISNVMPAKSLSSFFTMAQKSASQFVAANKQVGQGASGQSKISIKG
jgi:hypothetical protein